MFFNHHNPPHLHAKYSGDEARYGFEGNGLEGKLPRRASKIVAEWITLRRDELKATWERARTGQPLLPIEPLEQNHVAHY